HCLGFSVFISRHRLERGGVMRHERLISRLHHLVEHLERTPDNPDGIAVRLLLQETVTELNALQAWVRELEEQLAAAQGDANEENACGRH
ncbi:MAG TPA: hypothetical protein VGW38_04305, partial [Chloroflexota bacterium]|nr:hypothetical protein [Chloroflexota bacterium]